MKNWKDLYTELAEQASTIETIQWVDLWHNQINFMGEEHSFPTPALFIDFRLLNTEDQGELHQETTVQIGMYFYYETFLDTFQGAYNQEDALEYLDTLTALHQCFHGSSGENYAEMSRTGLQPVDTGNAGNLYLITFSCRVADVSAAKDWDTAKPNDLGVEKFVL